MLASRSAIASDSSANAGSKVLRGNEASPETLSRADSRNEERDDGRSGVVGREVRVRDVERARLALESRFELGIAAGGSCISLTIKEAAVFWSSVLLGW
jgi:hypothetical protein